MYCDGGRELLPFLDSENGAERSYAVTTIGWIGYEPAIPQVEDAMNSADWRIVYAAIRTLGWLGDTSVISVLDRIASDHWLPEVRAEAQQVARVLSSRGPIENGDNPFLRS
jgi:HEAT repeat protein